MRKSDPAFPRPYSEDTYGDYARPEPAQYGMDLRTYIATQVMAGHLAADVDDTWVQEALAAASVKAADALIAELNK